MNFPVDGGLICYEVNNTFIDKCKYVIMNQNALRNAENFCPSLALSGKIYKYSNATCKINNYTFHYGCLLGDSCE